MSARTRWHFYIAQSQLFYLYDFGKSDRCCTYSRATLQSALNFNKRVWHRLQYPVPTKVPWNVASLYLSSRSMIVVMIGWGNWISIYSYLNIDGCVATVVSWLSPRTVSNRRKTVIFNRKPTLYIWITHNYAEIF